MFMGSSPMGLPARAERPGAAHPSPCHPPGEPAGHGTRWAPV